MRLESCVQPDPVRRDGSSSAAGDPQRLAALPPGTRIQVKVGRDEIFPHLAALEELAGRCDQWGAAHGLAYVIDEVYAARKIPYLILFVDDAALLGAVLLFEYRAGGFRTGLFATGDSFGVRTVFGAEAQRTSLAAAACGVVIERYARLVLVSFKQEQAFASDAIATQPGIAYCVRARSVQDSMAIRSTLDETLAGLGKRTRTRLRAHRRRFDETVPCSFVKDALGSLRLDDDAFLVSLNRGSLDPIEQQTFNLQLRTTGSQRGGFISGLRLADGSWLALVGGWRQGATTWVDWQVNRAGLEKLSLGSVLRSYLIDEEVFRRSTVLGFHGGTSHSMAHHFVRHRVVDFLARKPGLLLSLGILAVRMAYRCLPGLAKRGNFLADSLQGPPLDWRRDTRQSAAFPGRGTKPA